MLTIALPLYLYLSGIHPFLSSPLSLIRSIPAVVGWFSRRKFGLPRLIPSL